MSERRPALPVLFIGAAVVLVPWTAWLSSSLPSRYLTHHWALAWVGFDTALAAGLALTGLAALQRAAWLDRAAAATATLLAADAWFDVVTARGPAAVALAGAEALAVELPVAFLCLWLALRPANPQRLHPTAHTPKGALQ